MNRYRICAAALLSLSATVSACSAGHPLRAVPAPTELRDLEAQHREDPAGHAIAALLGAAYLNEGRLEDADRVLSEARARIPDDLELIFLLGLAAEAAGNTERAKSLYGEYMSVDPSEAFVTEASGRVDRIQLASLPDSIRGLLAREAELAGSPADPTRVLMLPLVTDSGDPRAGPLARAFTELLPLDLERTGLFHAVDQARVRALLSAMGVTQAELAQPEIALRVGRVFGAGVVIGGTLRVADEDRIALQAAVVSVGTQGVRVRTSFSGEGTAAQIGELEQGLAATAAAVAGVDWSSKTVRNFERHTTRDIGVLIDFGVGLLAYDSGDWAAAATMFRVAVAKDGGFEIAAEHARAASYIEASNEPPGLLAWRAAQVALRRHGVLALLGGSGRQRALRGLPSERRAVLSELLGQDRLGSGSFVKLIFEIGRGGGR